MLLLSALAAMSLCLAPNPAFLVCQEAAACTQCKCLQKHPGSLQEAGSPADRLVLVAATSGVCTLRVSPEGRFQMLHSLTRPEGLREGCLPYAAWHLQAPRLGMAE